MALLTLIELSDQHKLSILQRLDRFRRWRSLDDKRYCLACGKVIDGHVLQIVGGTRRTGPLRLICPTLGCHSIPMDWVMPTDEVLARMSPNPLEAGSSLNSGDTSAARKPFQGAGRLTRLIQLAALWARSGSTLQDEQGVQRPKPRDGQRESFAARLRKFATQFLAS